MEKEELTTTLQSAKFYGTKVSKIVLEKLCNADRREKITIDKNITIEHIMPQTLTPAWRAELGEAELQNILDKYLHVLGNITLTGYNEKLSNKPFAEKKQIFLKSTIPLNQYFQQIDRWDKKAIETRGKRLAENINQLYGGDRYHLSHHKSNNTAGYQAIESISPTNTKPDPTYFLMESTYTCKRSWTSLSLDVLKKLYELDTDIFLAFAETSIHFSSDESDLRRPKRITSNLDLYIETHLDSKTQVKILSNILAEYNMTGKLMVKLNHRSDSNKHGE